MAKTRTKNPGLLLKRAIVLAGKLEELASQRHLRRRLLVAGFGFLVRIRRTAQAIDQLGVRFAYESGVLLRTMMEIRINYSWIRLKQTYSRSVRFFNYWSLERLKLLEKSATFFRPADFAQKKEALETERRKVRHLFRHRDRQGKMRWDVSWAQVSSVEARLREVQQAEAPDNPDLFLYGVYVLLSSAVHGSPNSLNQVLRVVNGRLSAKWQPESDPHRHRFGALLILTWTIETFATDAKLKQALHSDLRRLKEDIVGLATYRRAARQQAA